MKAPCIFVILDGMTEGAARADVPFLPQGCEMLRRFAREGGFGALENVPNGLPVDSLTCIATLLGVPMKRIPAGRAYLEALAAGIAVDADDAVCRANVTALSIADEMMGASAVLSVEEARALCKKISTSWCKANHLNTYKNLLVLRGARAGAADICTSPPHQHPGGRLGELLPRCAETAGTACGGLAPFAPSTAVFAQGGRAKDVACGGLAPSAPSTVVFVQGGRTEDAVCGAPICCAPDAAPHSAQWAQRLCALAENSRFTRNGEQFLLFPWDISVKPDLPRFAALHGMKAACVCKTEVVHGLCMAMGMAVTVPQSATAEDDTDLLEKAHTALALAKTYDIVLVHVNGADELAHRRDAAGKAQFLARADRELLRVLAEGLPQGGRLFICSDHATNGETGCHAGGAQPFFLWEKGGEPLGTLGMHSGRAAVELLAGHERKEGGM